jgi:hypothetical protein
MTDTMRERVARAALDAYYPQSLFSLDHPEREKFRAVADAVLAAMREPTKAMVNAGYDVGYSPDPLPCDAVWKAMIDAAIREGKE